ncbi:hypothetical protein [Undibacterium flavidum]|uniref:Peptidase M48 domain-containing protein n=1 Tax=Undibacterium flavidum TaxID=2762297 RepID=A0ABR6Y7T9_9BURK|nr:hypothetical protein [Undibacterium flavidum]MBC3872671.1 hypothetical protein [Undibacterium flavidum]
MSHSSRFKIIKRGFISLFALAFLYGAVIFFPSFLYTYQYQNENIVIYSDEKLPSNIDKLSLTILERIKKSAYYNAQHEYRIFISNENWRWRLIANLRPDAGGFNIEFCPNNSFIRPSVIAENRIIPPRATMADAADRDLVYFISHEITHGMMVNSTGLFTSLSKTKSWIKEGYADLIGKKSFDYASNLAQLKSHEKRLQISSGLYVRYHLALVYLIEKKGLSFAEIVDKNPPLEEVIDEMLALK